MSESEDRVVMWRDKLVDDMTREELLEAFQQVCRMLRSARRDHERTLDTWSLCRQARERR